MTTTKKKKSRKPDLKVEMVVWSGKDSFTCTLDNCAATVEPGNSIVQLRRSDGAPVRKVCSRRCAQNYIAELAALRGDDDEE